MKYLILSLLLTFSNIVFCQTLSLNEILSLYNTKNLIDMEDLLIERGFELKPMKDLQGIKPFIFLKRIDETGDEIIFSKMVKDNVNIMTTFASPLIADYQILKQQIKDSGFIFLRTEGDSPFLQHVFKKGGLELSLITNYNEDLKKNVYVINIIDPTIKEKVKRSVKKK